MSYKSSIFDRRTDDVSYSTVYKRFIHWVRIDLFKKIWSCLLDLYVSNKLKISKDWFKVIFIDTTMVKNVRGLDCKGRNHYDRNRFATKVSMVCDKNMVPLCSTFYPANNHDITTIDSTLAALHHDILPDKRYLHTLVADLGYLSNNQRKEYLRDTYRISLLTPYRKNQNKRNKRHEKKLLNKRVVIEHLFCRLDSFKRLKLREDGLLRNYSGLNYLAMALITISKM